MVNPSDAKDNLSLEDFMRNPPDNMEWVNGKLLEKASITLKHSKILGLLLFNWKTYITSNAPAGGSIDLHVPCRTNKHIRRPDLAYLTPELIEKFGKSKVFPQSFPLIAEIVSSTDLAEDLFLKAQEYLKSGCLEVWLVFPESRLVFVITKEQFLSFTCGQTVKNQKVLAGFSIAIDELLGLENVSIAQNSEPEINQSVVNESGNDNCEFPEGLTDEAESISSLEHKVYERVKKVLSEQLGIKLDDLVPTYCLGDANVDNLDMIELNMALEEEFDIEISDEDAEAIFKCSFIFPSYSLSSSFSSSSFSSSGYNYNNSYNALEKDNALEKVNVLATVQDIVDYIKQKI